MNPRFYERLYGFRGYMPAALAGAALLGIAGVVLWVLPLADPGPMPPAGLEPGSRPSASAPPTGSLDPPVESAVTAPSPASLPADPPVGPPPESGLPASVIEVPADDMDAPAEEPDRPPAGRRRAPRDRQPQQPTDAIEIYTVRAGDWLWRIAAGLCGHGRHWIEIYETNKEQIEIPDLIYPHQELIVPCR